VARGRHGAVVAPHHLATAAGLDVLRQGGHAVDAAIAANAALGVVMPDACGIGGDAFWLIWDAGAGAQLALNGSGEASPGLERAVRRRGLETMPERGPLTITVPGAVRSWAAAHDRLGRLPRERLLGAAIELASNGFPAWDGLIEAIEETAPIVARALGPDAAFLRQFRPQGRAWRPGELIRRPALAATLQRLADDGFPTFYDGALAGAQADGLAAAGVPITAADLRANRAEWGEPISTTYREVRVTSHPPNSSGIVALELLNILETFEPPEPSGWDAGGLRDPRWAHLAIEAAKLAMADRDRFLGDPAHVTVPVATLLEKGHAADLAGGIDPRRAGEPPAATNRSGGGTAYLGVVDSGGNAVSLIQSNYQGFGSGVADPATGISYHNRGSYFSLVGGHPNELAAGRRPLHTLLPGMLFRGAGGPWVVAGSMGGDAQPQIHGQLVSGLVDGGLGLAAAVAAPRWFVAPARHYAPPRVVVAEPRFEAGFLEALEALGHPVERAQPYDHGLGHEHAIELLAGGPAAEAGTIAAVTDPRSAGQPAVW
jgi:gamma-glutamyltranspeptidase / glutathione hydrolase